MPKFKLKQAWAEIKRHPGLYFLAFILWGLPLGLGTVWTMVAGSKTLPDWLAENGWPSLGVLVLGWLAMGSLIALVIIVRCLTSPQNLEQQGHHDGDNIRKRDFLIERLMDFTREAGQQWAGQSGMLRDFYIQSGSLEVGLSQKIEKFLELHLPSEVERFKKKGIDGVEEIIKELLDGRLITSQNGSVVNQIVKDSPRSNVAGRDLTIGK